MLWGNTNGSIGTVSALMLLIGAVLLLAFGIIHLRIPAAIGASFLITLFLGAGKGFDQLYFTTQFLGGGLILGSFFVATDCVTSPITRKGQIWYGVLIGVMTAASSAGRDRRGYGVRNTGIESVRAVYGTTDGAEALRKKKTGTGFTEQETVMIAYIKGALAYTEPEEERGSSGEQEESAIGFSFPDGIWICCLRWARNFACIRICRCGRMPSCCLAFSRRRIGSCFSSFWELMASVQRRPSVC